MPARDHDNDDLYHRLGWFTVADYADGHPALDGEAVGRALTRGATRTQLLAFAIRHVCWIVDHHRRDRARQAEDRAATVQAAGEAQQHRERGKPATRPSEHPDPDFEFQHLFDDPACFAGNATARKQFRRWAGDRFDEWYERGRKLAAGAGKRQLEFFESDWWPDGPHDYFAQKRVDAMFEVIRRTADEVRLETTRELLGTVFALGDGTETTWAAATVDQHEQRIGMLARNAAGVVETAARHEAAVRMIKDAGVTCLADLAGPDDDGPAPVQAVVA